VFQTPTLRECMRAGLLGAVAAGAFSGALATALVSSAPTVSPSLAASHVPAGRFATPHPSITISPSSGGPGTVLTISGKGFVPPPTAMGEAGAEIKYGNPRSAGGGVISSTGRVHITMKVVSTDRKGHNEVVVNEEYSCPNGVDGVCQTQATAPFTVK
jgi:hypothetical protein